MILTCPACGTRYNIADDAFGTAPRQVECIRCHHQWLEYPIAAPSAPALNATPAPALPTLPPATTTDNLENILHRAHTRPRRWAAATLITLALLGAAGAGFWAYQHGYFALPLTTASTTTPLPAGLSLGPVSKETVQQADNTILIFRGQIKHSGTTPVPTPRVTVHLFDATEAEVDAWPAHLGQPTIAPGQVVEWSVRFYNPPLSQITRFEARLGE